MNQGQGRSADAANLSDNTSGSTSGSISVDIVIVTYHSETIIAGCLDAIVDQQCDNVGVIVVDNDSTDDTLDLARRHPIGARVIESGGNFGYSAAINIGIENSSADAILILNPDTSMRPGSIDALRARLATPGVGIVAPTILDTTGERQLTIRRFPTVLNLLGQNLVGSKRASRFRTFSDFVVDDSAYEQSGTHDWCSGAVLLVGRPCIEQVGPWDESFFLYSEETDYCWRANIAGFATLFEPRAVVEHIGGDSGTSSRLWSILVANKVVLVHKHRGSMHGWAYWMVSVVGELARSFRPRNRSAFIGLVTGRVDPAVRDARAREAARQGQAANLERN